MPFPESHGTLCFRAILPFCPAGLLDSTPIKLLNRYARSRGNNTFSSFFLPVQVMNEKRQIRRSCLMFNLFTECDSDLVIILGYSVALKRSDQCPCPKGNSECIDMNSVLLRVLRAVLFTSSPDDGSWTRIWQEQWQKLFSFHNALCLPSVLRGWEDEANQLRVPSRDGWPRGIKTPPSPGRRSTQERNICSRRVWTFLLKSCLWGLWAAFWLCGERSPTGALGKRLVQRMDKPVPLQCDPFLGCLRGAFQKESFWWIMLHQLGLSFAAWPIILVWVRAEHLSP